jgi:uncharacterized integral membrane protein
VEKVKLIGAIVLGVLALVVMVQNRATVETEILFFSFRMPRAILLLLTFVLGVAAGWLLAWRRSHRN